MHTYSPEQVAAGSSSARCVRQDIYVPTFNSGTFPEKIVAQVQAGVNIGIGKAVDFRLKCLDYVLKCLDYVLKCLDSVLKCLDFVLKMSRFCVEIDLGDRKPWGFACGYGQGAFSIEECFHFLF